MITYNHEPYIAKAIEGVLMQKTGFPFELIIGEDCSTDRTREIVLEYQKKHPNIIRVLTSESNVGMHKNLRHVYDACRGKYIAYCEGDDYWHNPLKLKKQVECLESHPDVGLVHSDAAWHLVEKKKTISTFYKNRPIVNLPRQGAVLLHNIITFKYPVVTCTVMVRTSILMEIRKECQYEFSDKWLMTDTQIFAEFAHRSKFSYIDEPLATRNSLPESACLSKSPEKSLKFMRNALELDLHYANKYGGVDRNKIRTILINQYATSLSFLASQHCRLDIAKEALDLVRKEKLRFGLLSWLYYFGSLNFLFSWLVWTLIQPAKIARRCIRYLLA
ncbi:MAG: glycosyltransferase [Proteobacteria bacterium]|nr:glycosyltransferase [Pseudomonadota bacterium]